MRVTLLIAVLIAYGSIYPGDFSTPAPGALEKMLNDWRWFTSLSDVLGNIGLFVPLGAAGVFFTTGTRNADWRDAWLLVMALIFALVLQLAQVWLPSRSAALADVVWNGLGTLLGMVAGYALSRRTRQGLHLAHPTRLMPYAILICWLLAELLPLVPALDWQKFKDAVKPLLLEFDITVPTALLHAAGVLVAGSALIALGRRPLGWLALAVIIILVGKLLVVTLSIDGALVLGLFAGYVACVVLARFGKRVFDAALWCLLLAWSVALLTPFTFATGGSFNAIPFATMLRGSMETSVQGLAQSIFIYSALLWLVQRLGGRIAGATVGLAIWASLLELTQMGLLGRTADLTEPLLVLLVGWGMAAMQGQASVSPLPAPPSPAKSPVLPTAAPRASTRGWWMMLGFSVIGLALLLWGTLRLPGIPYNLRELFLGGGQFFYFMIFALALLWLGGGAVWVSKQVAASKWPYLSLPIWVLAASFISLMLLALSVTQESLDDIAGSNNLYWFVLNRNIWGDGWRAIFVILGPEVIAVLERMGRYAALYSPPLIFLALPLIMVAARATWSTGRFAALLASALLLLWLAKAVAFDWSSTDNLNELIARDGPMGWGGGGYLYALLSLLCVNAVIIGLAHGFSRLALVGVVSIAALPLGWWLLNLGLEAQVEKYDLVFSGAQFLLGPDRAHLLSEMGLFARWCVLQIGFVVVTGVGIRSALLYPYRGPQR